MINKINRVLDKLYLLYLTTKPNISLTRPCSISRKAEISVCFGGNINIGQASEIHNGVILNTYGGNINIGSFCSLNPYTIIYGNGGVFIGNEVRIAAHCTIIAFNHNFKAKKLPVIQQGLSKEGIRIEDDVWLGSGVRVLDGITIAKGTIVGAGSVVTKSTKENGVYVGVPAKLMRMRE